MHFATLSSAFVIALAAGVNAAAVESRDGTHSQWTFYNPPSLRPGACGRVVNPTDIVVALDPTQFANGSHCFGLVTLTASDKSIQALVADECVSCPPGGLDLTPSLFKDFAPLSVGLIHGDWAFTP